MVQRYQSNCDGDLYIPEAKAKGAGHGELFSNPHVKCRKQVGS